VELLPSTVMLPSAVNLAPKANQHIYEPIYICGKSSVKLPLLFFRYSILKVFGTHRLTHSLTDGQTRIHCASSTIFQW